MNCTESLDRLQAALSRIRDCSLLAQIILISSMGQSIPTRNVPGCTEEPWDPLALCIPLARSSSFPNQSEDHQAAALGTQLQLGLGKARYSSWMKYSQITTKSSIPHQIRHDNAQLLTSTIPVELSPLSCCYPHTSTRLCAAGCRKQTGSLILLLYTISSTKHKDTELSPTPRWSLSSRRGDTSNSLVPMAQWRAEQLASGFDYTCLLPAGSNALLHPASSHNFGEGKEKPVIVTTWI